MKGAGFFWLLLIGGGLLLLTDGGIVSAAPFKTDKLSVLIVEETEQEQLLTAGQRNALHSTKSGSLLDYLSTHGQWRILDKDDSVEREIEPWKSAFTVTKKEKLPAACISNGRSGFNGPLPENEADIIALVKKYGGA